MQQSHINLADDPDAVNKTKHMGRAYKCIPCHYKEGKETIDVKGRIKEYILKNHVSLDEVPYYCQLCLFVVSDMSSLYSISLTTLGTGRWLLRGPSQTTRLYWSLVKTHINLVTWIT